MAVAEEILRKWEDSKERYISDIKKYNKELELANKAYSGQSDLPEEAFIYEKNLKDIESKWDTTVDILIDEVEKDLVGPYKIYNVVDEGIIGRYIDFGEKEDYTYQEILDIIEKEFYKDLLTIFPKSSVELTPSIADEESNSDLINTILSLSKDMDTDEIEELLLYIQKQYGTIGNSVSDHLKDLSREELENVHDILEEYVDIAKLTKVKEGE